MDFDDAEVEIDFARIADAGFDSIRVFLTWEDFQPNPERVKAGMLDRLVTVADLAAQAGLAVMPTLFTGHMSNVNWIPTWALGGSSGDDRFRVISGGSVAGTGLRNWYTDPKVGEAQALLAREAATALAGHDALWAWDLGNENSNCVIPPSRSSARDWLGRISSAIRAADPAVLVTIGLHMEDLEEDRKLGPGEAAEVCDFLTMHGYPIYARWADGPTDEHVLPFLAHLTRWLGDGCDVLFSEFGLPTLRRSDPVDQQASRQRSPVLVEEQAAAGYTERALSALHGAGCTGAMLWCYSDYIPAIWVNPPLDVAIHERSFGLWRADGSPKPSVQAIEAFAGVDRIDGPSTEEWIDIAPDEFIENPAISLTRLYGRYRRSKEPISP
ncbi:MAG: cellulase family glycosylhydrolase [Acidimicrobiia bacterium]|nr:cellulase family glycosylhydrolase [Acidimicrobiia bacterium]